MSGLVPSTRAAVDAAAGHVPDRWPWILLLVSAVVIAALVALILGNTIFAADPMTGT